MNNKVYSSQEVRKLEERLFVNPETTAFELMKKAGRAAYNFLKQQKFDKLVFLCGKGNNGGDAYCMAQLAHQEGIPYECVSFEKPKSETALKALTQAENSKVIIKDNLDFSQLENRKVILVDALFGIGLDRELTENYRKFIEKINQFKGNNKDFRILSLDIPSGLSADTGLPLPCAIYADWTFGFLVYKQGYFLGQAFDFCGELILSDLEVNKIFFKQSLASFSLIDQKILSQFPERKKCSHKGNFGHLLIIGGLEGMLGSIMMAGMAASRMGLGKLSFLSLKEHYPSLIEKIPMAMTCSYSPLSSSPFLFNASKKNIACFKKIIADKTAILIGTGLGQSQWAKDLLDMTLEFQGDKKVVLDADALNILARSKRVLNERCIITPHPAEAGKLLKISTQKLQNNRLRYCSLLYEKYKAICVLKGKGSLIKSARDLLLCSEGNSGMATAGMGDVLSGMIGGLVCQDIDPYTATCLATYYHSYKADQVVKNRSEHSLLPTDIIYSL